MCNPIKLFTAGAAIAAAGCVSVLPEASPASARYTIAPVQFTEPAAQSVEWSLAIADPTATRAYDTAKIALTRAQGQIEYYANGEWADRGPRLVRTALVRSYENSGRILGVGDTVSLPGADFILQTDIRSLHVQYANGEPAAEVALYAKLTDRRGRILAARLFSQSQQLGGDSPTAAGRAFDTATTGVISDIVTWSTEAATDVWQAKQAS